MCTTMPKRSCDYKDCKEFRDKTYSDPSITFFSFPPDAERRKKWLQNSQTTSQNPKYLCSKHFEEKYMSHNQRRVHLIASAVPIEYQSDETNVSDEHVLSEEEKNAIETFGMCCTSFDSAEETNFVGDDIEEDIAVDVENPKSNEEVPSTLLLNSRLEQQFAKRSIESSSVQSHQIKKMKPKKIKIIKLNDSNIDIFAKKFNQNKAVFYNRKVEENDKEDEENSKSYESDEETIQSSNSKIRRFIFKGEEYIQMPQSLYDKEKNDLLSQINDYRIILQKFKSQLDALNLD